MRNMARMFRGKPPMSAIYILWLRAVKRYVRSKPRIIASLGQPLLFLIALGFGFGPIFQKAGQGNYIQFLAPGVIAMTILFTAIFSGIELIWDRQFGFLKETLVAPVPRILVMIGRTLGGATVAMIQGVIVVVICFIAGFRVTNFHALPIADAGHDSGGCHVHRARHRHRFGAVGLSGLSAHHELFGDADLLPLRRVVPADESAEDTERDRQHRSAFLRRGRSSQRPGGHRSFRHSAGSGGALHHHRCPARNGQLLIFEDSALNKIVPISDAAVADIPDGATIMLGGFGLAGMPENLIRALVRKRRQRTAHHQQQYGRRWRAAPGLMLEAGMIASHLGSYVGENKLLESLVIAGKLKLTLIPQGTLAERIRAGGAGIPAFYTPAGVGTVVAEGKEVREFDGRSYLLERALTADFALVKAWRGDRLGNLVYRKTAQNFNPMMAAAAKITIAEVEELVEAGRHRSGSCAHARHLRAAHRAGRALRQNASSGER